MVGLVFLLFAGLSGRGQIEGISDKPKVTKVDEVVIAIGPTEESHVALAFDQDDKVGTYFWRKSKHQPSAEPRLREYLGYRVSHSGSVSLAELLPKTEVATIARRVTHDQNHRSHVVLTWGFAKTDDDGSVGYNIYVFSEDPRTGSVRLTYEDRNVNRELNDLVVEDINGDEKVEIVDIGREAKIALATIRTLEPSGTVSELQEISGQHITFGLVYGRQGGGFLITKELRPGRQPGRRCYSVDEFAWSSKRGQFVSRNVKDPRVD